MIVILSPNILENELKNHLGGMELLLQLRQQGIRRLPIINQLQSSKKERLHFRLKGFKNKYFKTDLLVEEAKCAIEIYKAGLMLKGDFPHKHNAISILADEIISITLVRGKHTIDTFRMSPVHILSKLGTSSCIARHFRLDPNEYKVEDTKIILTTKDQKLELSSCGHRFNRLRRLFKAAGYKKKLQVVKEPSYRIVDDIIQKAF